MSTYPGSVASNNIKFLARDDQGGRLDGVQVIVHKGYAYIGHMFADGFSVVDVRDPAKPKTVAFVAAPPNTRSHHLQIHGDLLVCVNGPNIWAMQQYASQADYYATSLADSFKEREQPFGAGIRVFDISKPAAPREISYLHMPGFGAHRIWWVGGRYAYVSAHLAGFIDHVLAIVDLADPAKPVMAGHWWLPGMWRAGGETPPPSFGKRTALHHMIMADNHRLFRLARRRLYRSRPERPGEAEASQPPQLRAAFRRRRSYALAAAEAQTAGAGRRGDLRQLREWACLYLGDRRARAGKSGIDRHAAAAGRG